MESHSITVNPINEENKDLPIIEGVQYIDDAIECNVCYNIMTCFCFAVCLFTMFMMLGGYYVLAAGGSDDPA